MPSFDSCAFSTKSVGKLPNADIRATAKRYEKEGMGASEAMVRALQDRLDLALLDEKRITAAVRSAYDKRSGASPESDGVRYSVSGDVTDTPAFRKWFGESKVVDAKGKPLVVYHGSPDMRFMDDDGIFKSQREKLGFGREEAAHWFAASPATAKSYADPHRAFDYQNSEPGVMPAYLKMENPLIVDGGGQKWRDAQKSGKTTDVIREARDGGHDGVIIRNVRDNYQTGVAKGDRATDTYVVFASTQIKSADRNSGDFDPANPDVRYSTASPLAAAPLRMVNPFVRKLADAGKIVLHDDASTLPVKGKAPAGVQALTTKEGTIHVVANALGSNARGIVLHEAFHAGGEALVGSAAWSKLMKRMDTLHALAGKNSGAVGEFFSQARDRVAAAKGKGAVASGMEAEEFGAYAIEEYARAPASVKKWVDDLLGAVKAWALSRFGAQLGDVTPAQLSALAQLALLDVQATRMEPAFSVNDKRTIEVDGVRHPIRDSEGNLVAPDFMGQVEFWRAYTGPVDDEGRPILSGEPDDGMRYSVRMPDWLNNMSQDTQEAARKAGIWAKQVPLAERLKDLRKRAWGEFTQGMFDQFAPIMRLNYKAYILARLTKSADAPLESILLYGKPFLNSAGAIDVNLERGGLIAVLQSLNGEHDRFFAWIAGNRAAKLKMEGRENLFTDTDISSLKDLSAGNMADGSSRQKLYEQTLIKFNQYSKAVMDIAEKAGIIDGASRSVWENDFYVPFYRVAEEGGKVVGPRSGGGALVNQYAFKKLRGGTDELNDLMHNTMRNWSHLIAASLNNQAAAATIRAAEAQGIALPATSDEKGTVSYLENGVQKHFHVNDSLLMDAITALEWAGWNNPAMKAFQKAKHYLTMGVTISPEFKIANLVRDQLSAVAVNPVSGNIMRNLVEGWQGTDKESPQYAKMLAGGGLMRFGTFLEGDRAEHVKRLVDSGVNSAQILTTPARVKGLLSAAWDGWQEVGDRSENITRAAIYKQRYDQVAGLGFSADESHLIASFSARDSMDFSLQGKWVTIRFLSQLVPFMNARLQGLYKLGRDGMAPSARMIAPRLFGSATVSDRAKAKRFGATVMAVSLASIALMLAQGDDDDYKELEDWKRDAYWCVKVGGMMYFIPKPFEVGAIGTLAERGLEMMMNGMDKDARALFGKRMGDMLMNTFAMNPTPQLVKPMIDLYANKNSFTGRPIETPDLERLSKSERIGPRTSATAQLAGKVTGAVGLSPIQVDHLINGYFGWLGAHAVMTADFATRPLMGLPDAPTRRFPEDYMVIGRFASDLPSDQSKYVTEFYKQAKEVQQAMADIRHYQSMGMKWRVDELREDNQDIMRIAPLYDAALGDLGDINKEIKMTQYRKLTPDEKRERIDFLTRKRNALAKRVDELRKKREAQSPVE